jgi:photosystem II stability/assembly factor-like uncharacterized protein
MISMKYTFFNSIIKSALSVLYSFILISSINILTINFIFSQNKPVKQNNNTTLQKQVGINKNLEDEEEKNEWDNAKGREEFRRRQRLDENGKYNNNAILLAKQHNDLIWQQKDAGIWNWEWLGPGNIGGRCRTIVVDPNNPSIIYIGSVSGGIWKSINGGASWTALSDFIANLAVTSIVIDPTNTNILYAATGEGFGNIDGLPGVGIFKTTDAGVTWNQLINTSNWQHCNRLAISPSNHNILFAVGDDPLQFWGQIYKSTDGGNTWTVNYVANQNSEEFVDIKICPLNSNLMLAGCYIGAYLSTNGGATWRWLATGNTGDLPLGNPSLGNLGRCEIAFAPTNANTIYISADRNNGEIWKSIDGGTTWSCVNTGSNYFFYQGWYDNAIAVSPTDPNFVVVGGMDIYKSTNGGTTLTRISNWSYYFNGSYFSPHADHHVLVFSSGYNGTSNKILYNGNDGGVQSTNDITTVTTTSGWINLNNSLGITQFYGGSAAPDGSVIIGGAQDNANLKYTPATGVNGWTYWSSGDGGFCAVDYASPSTLYGEYVYGDLEKSVNGALSPYNNGKTESGSSYFLFIAPLVIDPNSSSILYSGGSSLWRNKNDGNNWLLIRGHVSDNSKCTAIAVSKANSNVIWAGYEYGIVSKTTDGGSTWTNVNTGLPARYVTDIAIATDNSNSVVVTLGGCTSSNIYYSSNGGTSWTLISGTSPKNIPAIQINTVSFNPYNSSWIYVGTDAGVYASEDLGAHWRLTPRYTGNEGPCNVEVDELIWQGYYLIAVTHGRGMYRCLPLNTVIVDNSLSVNGNGTPASPYNNPNTAVDNIGHGATMIFKCGTGTYTLDAAHHQASINKRIHVSIDCNGGNVKIN